MHGLGGIWSTSSPQQTEVTCEMAILFLNLIVLGGVVGQMISCNLPFLFLNLIVLGGVVGQMISYRLPILFSTQPSHFSSPFLLIELAVPASRLWHSRFSGTTT